MGIGHLAPAVAQAQAQAPAPAPAPAPDRRCRRENKMWEIRDCKRKAYFKCSEMSPSFPSATTTSKQATKELKRFSLVVGGLWSRDTKLQLQATIQICELLSSEQKPPIDRVIRSGVVPRFVEFLKKDAFPELQCEAAWALANIASETSIGTQEVIDKNALPKFVKLLCSANADVCEQAVFALGIVAGHSPTCRDSVLGLGALVPLLKRFKGDPTLSMLRNATWTLLNFSGGVPRPSINQVRPAHETLKHLLDREDEEVLVDSCLALSYLVEGKCNEVEEVIKVDVCPRLVKLLNHHSSSVVLSALQTIGNIIISGNDTHIQVIINHGALEYLLRLLNGSHNDMVIKHDACFIISNIAAGNMDHIQAVIDAQMIEPLVQLLQDAEFEIRECAARALAHVATCGSSKQIKSLLTVSCIKGLFDLVLLPDMLYLFTVLEGLYNIMTKGRLNYKDRLIKDSMDVNKLDPLSGHSSAEVAEMASLLESHHIKKRRKRRALV